MMTMTMMFIRNGGRRVPLEIHQHSLLSVNIMLLERDGDQLLCTPWTLRRGLTLFTDSSVVVGLLLPDF